MGMERLFVNHQLLQSLVFVSLLLIFSVIKTATIEVSAWITHPDSSNFRVNLSRLKFGSHRWTTSVELYPKGSGEKDGKRQQKDTKREQNQFFLNTTELYYRSDDGNTVVVENSTDSLLLMNSSSMEPKTSPGGTFGDIMSPTIEDADVLFQDGLVTSETNSLEETYGIENPLDRMAVTANGNLQRLLSSFYDAPVMVEMVYCTRQKPLNVNAIQSSETDESAIWDRRVLLKIFGNQTFCTADSVVEVHSREAEELIESGKVGIGQIFRHYNILPEFTLLAAAPTAEGGFWRNYTLESSIVTCSIREVFCAGLWELSPTAVKRFE
mmetsp:Transcript_12143/g.28812  ORF Transcript_12143/g.28812 Transcript_12143/m.28812 type:complete len:325 (+) Transcript_12143:238-1212(+)